jgi:hypothetical protein
MFAGGFVGSLHDPIVVVAGLVALVLGAIGGRVWWAPVYALVFTVLRAWSSVSYRETLGLEPHLDLMALFGAMWFIQMLLVFFFGWGLRQLVRTARRPSQ